MTTRGVKKKPPPVKVPIADVVRSLRNLGWRRVSGRPNNLTRFYSLNFSGTAVKGIATISIKNIERHIGVLTGDIPRPAYPHKGWFQPTIRWRERTGQCMHPHAQGNGTLCWHAAIINPPPADILPDYLASVLTAAPGQFNMGNRANSRWNNCYKCGRVAYLGNSWAVLVCQKCRGANR